eukprot:126435-Rhodomonas_salina.1
MTSGAAGEQVRLMLLVHHPNCHFLIGAKTTPEDGGPLLLTEVALSRARALSLFLRFQRWLWIGCAVFVWCGCCGKEFGVSCGGRSCEGAG